MSRVRGRIAHRFRATGALAVIVLALMIVRHLMLGGAGVLSLLVATGVLR